MMINLPAWMHGAAIMQRLNWATKENYDRFMASDVGQGVQTVSICASALFAAFRAGKAVTTGSYLELVPPIVYGVTAVFAWSGKNATKKLLEIDRLVDRVAENGQGEAQALAEVKKAQDGLALALDNATIAVKQFEAVNKDLLEQLEASQRDCEKYKNKCSAFGSEVERITKEFDKVLGKKHLYKTIYASIKESNPGLSAQFAVYDKQIRDLAQKHKVH
jgi:hypothetical protein